MLAQNILSHEILPLKATDTGEHALTMMSVYNIKHLPVVDHNKFMGLISEDELLSQDAEITIGKMEIQNNYGFVSPNEHVFDIMKKVSHQELTSIAVIDGNNENYIGLVTLESLMNFFADSYAFDEPGSLIVIKSDRANYVLSDIVRIIESEDATVLTSFISKAPDSNEVFISLKITSQEINRIISALERYEYTVSATFSEQVYESNLKDRYDMLMTYLNV